MAVYCLVTHPVWVCCVTSVGFKLATTGGSCRKNRQLVGKALVVTVCLLL